MDWKRNPIVAAAAIALLASLAPSFADAPDLCPAVPKSSYLTTWNSLYPTSRSDDNVIDGTGRSCQLCHQERNGGANYNGYGWGLYLLVQQGQSVQNAILMMQDVDSDLDPAGSTNLVEIQVNTQPGWTVGPHNTIYFPDNSTLTNQLPPADILGNLDPTAGDPDIDVSPLSLDFGAVVVGQSRGLTTTIGNTGPNDLTVTALTIQGSADFALNASSPSPPFVVRSNESAVVTVDFSPNTAVAHAGTLVVASDDPDEPTVNVTLAGTGVTAPEPDIDVSPLTLAFGSVGVNSTKTLSTTIRNVGTGNLTVSVIRLGGGSSTAYSLNSSAPVPPVVIAPNTSADVPVDFRPSSTGWNAGILDIWSDDPDEFLVSVNLTGTGVTGAPDIQVFPLTLAFGSVGVGNKKTLTTRISNVGTASLTVSDLLLQGDPAFALGAGAPTVPFEVPPDGAVDVPVDFSSTAGVHNGTLDVVSNDGDQPQIAVALTGSGSTAIVDLDIKDFNVPRRYRGRPIQIELIVENNGAVDQPVEATVTGKQNGDVVYQRTLMVRDPLRNGSTRYGFPEFTPTILVDISWEAVIADDDPDDDRAVATTTMSKK